MTTEMIDPMDAMTEDEDDASDDEGDIMDGGFEDDVEVMKLAVERAEEENAKLRRRVEELERLQTAAELRFDEDEDEAILCHRRADEQRATTETPLHFQPMAESVRAAGPTRQHGRVRDAHLLVGHARSRAFARRRRPRQAAAAPAARCGQGRLLRADGVRVPQGEPV